MAEYSEVDKYDIVNKAILQTANRYKIDFEDFQCYASEKLIFNNEVFRSKKLLFFMLYNMAKNYIRQKVNREKLIMKDRPYIMKGNLMEYLPDNISEEKKQIFYLIFIAGMSRTECARTLKQNWRTVVKQYNELLKIVRESNASIF
jgi:hypothetical protein